VEGLDGVDVLDYVAPVAELGGQRIGEAVIVFDDEKPGTLLLCGLVSQSLVLFVAAGAVLLAVPHLTGSPATRAGSDTRAVAPPPRRSSRTSSAPTASTKL